MIPTEDIDRRYIFPNVVKTIRIIGDQIYGNLFTREAGRLAYQVRNSMTFNKLDQSKGQKIFSDGTRITVNSFFGQDLITIDVSQSTGEEGTTLAKKQCSVTFINLPSSVQPMKEPGKVLTDEMSGVDYIKTYYLFDVGQCPDCQDIKMDFLFNYSIPVESRHHDDEVKNHCIYSLDPSCWGEVISHGHDAQGDYFIWKAYTESGVYSRTGLGILDLKASISDLNGEVICDVDKKIDVDCCLKGSDNRKVEIWWEDFGTCTPYIPYQGVVYNAICKMPTEVSIGGTAGLAWYGCTHPQQPLYAIPEIKGSCLPVEWTFSGPIELLDPNKKNDNTIFFKCIEGACNEEATITLRDRCGTEYIVRGRPCCEDAAAPSINYTSLLMSCSQYQTLNAFGGCGPYSWSISGGGGTLNTNTGSEVIYHAPATNANCTDNPTITVTDCCGGSANLQLAINCYSASGTALGYTSLEVCECRHYTNCNICGFCYYGSGNWHTRKWDCSGTLTYDCETNPGCSVGSWPSCGSYTVEYKGAQGCYSETNCWNNQCGCGCGLSCPCNAIKDCRTQDQKDAGCCPINPLTGLPY